jgi:hypothetical protein
VRIRGRGRVPPELVLAPIIPAGRDPPSPTARDFELNDIQLPHLVRPGRLFCERGLARLSQLPTFTPVTGLRGVMAVLSGHRPHFPVSPRWVRQTVPHSTIGDLVPGRPRPWSLHTFSLLPGLGLFAPPGPLGHAHHLVFGIPTSVRITSRFSKNPSGPPHSSFTPRFPRPIRPTLTLDPQPQLRVASAQQTHHDPKPTRIDPLAGTTASNSRSTAHTRYPNGQPR